MDLVIVLMLGTIAAAVLLGVLIGRISARSEITEKVESAIQKGREESEVEKASIALELSQQLIKMRDSIKQAADAYKGTVQVVRERLASSIELLPAQDSEKKVLDGGDMQLSLEFGKPIAEQKARVRPAVAANADSAEEHDPEESHDGNGADVSEFRDQRKLSALDSELDEAIHRGDLPIQ